MNDKKIRENKGAILIVDDNPKNLQVIGSLLSGAGYSIALASGGKMALNMLDRKKADLILLDIMMPEMDGYETIQIIKANPEICDIPVIFLTAKSDSDDIVKGLQLGAVDYVKKPFNKEEILSRINTHIELKYSKDIIIEQNKKLHDSEVNLKNLNDTKDKFFSIIAHDLRNPLAALSSITSMLYSDYDDFSDEEKRDLIFSMYNSSSMVSALLENLLTWSRSQTGKIQHNPTNCDMNYIVQSVVGVYRINADKKNISFVTDKQEEVFAYADPEMINTVMRNLISNAIKFTNKGGMINISLKASGDSVEVSVKDNGIGIAEADIEKLFRIDVHHLSYGTDNEKGTGLGLILCKDFIEMNGGTISVQSELGKGSEISFKIPLAPHEEGS